MSNLRLNYFDFHGSRGEAARLALFIGNIPFDDNRIAVNDWSKVKEKMPFQAIPVLEVDGKTITQSNTINRYIGRIANLYPGDEWQAAQCDEVMDAVEEVVSKISRTIKLQDEDEKRSARIVLAKGVLPLYLTRLESSLKERGGKYFASDKLTVADLVVFVWIRGLRKGLLDHIPADLVDKTVPLLVEHAERISKHPKILEYYENHSIH